MYQGFRVGSIDSDSDPDSDPERYRELLATCEEMRRLWYGSSGD